MIEALLSPASPGPLRVLCFGAHCDDIEIGCGGTLLRLLEGRRKVEVEWVVFSGNERRRRELQASARKFLRRAARVDVRTLDFRDACFPAQYAAIKEAVEAVRASADPHVVFTHHREDLHQDHRLVGELTWNAFRSQLILEYEILKYDGGLLPPNAYVRLERPHVEAKVRYLMSSYVTQRAKEWFTEDAFRAMMRVRGVECAAPAGWAEAFHARKVCLG